MRRKLDLEKDCYHAVQAGMMLVGQLGEDGVVLRAVDAWQRAFGR